MREGSFSHKHQTNGLKVQTAVCHRGVLNKYIFHYSQPIKAAQHDKSFYEATTLPELRLPGEVYLGDKGYAGATGVCSPFKGRDLNPTQKQYNRQLSAIHVKVEHANRDMNVFNSVGKPFHFKLPGGHGLNLGLLADIWHIVVFMVNRNSLDEMDQVRAWRIPTRPQLADVGAWAQAPLDAELTEWYEQGHDDFGGPTGVRRATTTADA